MVRAMKNERYNNNNIVFNLVLWNTTINIIFDECMMCLKRHTRTDWNWNWIWPLDEQVMEEIILGIGIVEKIKRWGKKKQNRVHPN